MIENEQWNKIINFKLEIHIQTLMLLKKDKELKYYLKLN
jgi:hypothetical protein